MKSLKSILLLLICTISSLGAMAQAEITFTETKHNFGEIQEQDGPVTHSFQFKNTGNSPLILNSVNASCGCTTPKWTKAPVAPGQSGTIEVTYNPLNRPGAFNKSIAVSANTKKAVSLSIQGNVLQKPKTLSELYPHALGNVSVKTSYIRLGEVNNTEVREGTLEVANTSDKPQVIEFRTPPSHMSVRAEPSTIAPGKTGTITVRFDGQAYNNFGDVVSRLYLLVDGDASYKNSIGISATVVEDFSSLSASERANAPKVSFDTDSYDFGEIQEDAKVNHTFKLTNKGKTNLIIRKVTTSCGCTAVTPQKKVIAPGETVPLDVKFDSKGKFGRQSKTIKIITNAPDSQMTTLRISAVIVKK
ncbi:MAG: DUF1573 domain-containing protein [Mangrovibacterium sp.]